MSRTRIKFCGMTRVEDALAAAELGVDAIGVIFATRSPRRASLEQAQAIHEALPVFVDLVALFMDNSAAEVAAVVDQLAPDLLQFHGAETDAWCRQFGRPYLKAIAMGEGEAALGELQRYPGARALLLDGHGLGQPGGAGKRFDWSLVPQTTFQPLILAGGLNAGNVGLAVRQARPWAVDASSGIESAPGIKELQAMRAFVAAVADADHAARHGLG
ncbi:phosphoribosylanthranilate isomerase [Frateuria aurantia]